LKYIARAPGKIIITGEHFVVHGSYALAAAIDRCSFATASLSERSLIISKDLGYSNSLDEVGTSLEPLIKTLKATLDYLNENRGVKLEINSDIPLSAGLGSSASSAVAVVAATSKLLGHELKLDEIFKLAMVSERIIHGTPSGIDVIVALHGGVSLFKIKDIHKKVNINSPIDFIIGFCGIKHKTSEQISNFLERSKSHPSIFKAIVDSISYFAVNAAQAMENGDLCTLADIMNSNHSILTHYGVSSEVLNRLIDSALQKGSLGAKLTGGGGGGSLIILPATGQSSKIQNQLKDSFSQSWSVTIPQKGLQTWKIKNE
jgi:mevalonate kinase